MPGKFMRSFNTAVGKSPSGIISSEATTRSDGTGVSDGC